MVFSGGLRYVSDIMVDKYYENVTDEDPLECQGKSLRGREIVSVP